MLPSTWSECVLVSCEAASTVVHVQEKPTKGKLRFLRPPYPVFVRELGSGTSSLLHKPFKKIHGGMLCALHDWLAACLSSDRPLEIQPEASRGQIIVNNRIINEKACWRVSTTWKQWTI